MLRLVLVFGVCLGLGLAACEEEAPNRPPKAPPSEGVGEAPPPSKRIDAGSRATTRPVSELAGTWRGEATTREEGTVTGVLRVSRDGAVSFEVKSQGKRESGTFRIESWDGATMQVRDGSRTYRVRGALRGDSFRTRLPLAGDVVLRRSKQ